MSLIDKLFEFLNSYNFLISYKEEIEENHINLNKNLLGIIAEIFVKEEKIESDFLNVLLDFILFLFKSNYKEYNFSINRLIILGKIFNCLNKNNENLDEKSSEIYERIFSDFVGSSYFNEIFYFDNLENAEEENFGIDFNYTFYLMDLIINILQFSNGKRISYIIKNSDILIPYLIEIFEEIEKRVTNISDFQRNILFEKILDSFNIIILHDKKLIYNHINLDKRLLNFIGNFKLDKILNKKLLFILNNLVVLANNNHSELHKLINYGILNFLKEIFISSNDTEEIIISLNITFFYLFSFDDKNSDENKIIDLFNMEIGIEILEKFIFFNDKIIKQKICVIFDEFFLTENNIKKLISYNFTFENLANIYKQLKEEKEKSIENPYNFFMDFNLITPNFFNKLKIY